MEKAKIVVDTDRWLEETFKAFDTFRETRKGSVSAEEAEFVQSRLHDLWWLAHTSHAELYDHCERGLFPSWVFADQPDPRTAVETFKYLLLFARKACEGGEVPYSIVPFLSPSATDPTGNTTVLEALLSYRETDRSAELTDIITQEAEEVCSLWISFASYWMPESTRERLVITPSDDTTKLFGFEIVKGQFVRIAVGEPTPFLLEEVFNEQLQIVRSYSDRAYDPFWKWEIASILMEPAIAYRRVVFPLIAFILYGMCDRDIDFNIVGLDEGWEDWVEFSDDPAYAVLENALLAGLTEDEAEATCDEWTEALRLSRERNNERTDVRGSHGYM
jgi:hypothetical protein